MLIPDSLFYSYTHEWIFIDENIATIGITDFAQGELGDVIFLEFPEIGQKVFQDDPFGTIEAVKTVADLISPVTGKVVAVNESLNDAPELVNNDVYNEGWIIKIELSIPSEIDDLLSADDYKKIIQ